MAVRYSTMDYAENIETQLNSLVKHALTLERENANLKHVIRLFASGMALTPEGKQEFSLEQHQADTIKRICLDSEVF